MEADGSHQIFRESDPMTADRIESCAAKRAVRADGHRCAGPVHPLHDRTIERECLLRRGAGYKRFIRIVVRL